MARRQYSSTAQATTLTTTVASGTTTMVVTAATGFPASTPYTMIVDPDTVNEEVVEVTNRSGTTLTVTRGVDGTSAVAHSAGAVIRHGVSARDFDEPNSFLNAGGTVGGNVSVTGTVSATSTVSGSGLAGSLLSSASPVTIGTAAAGTSAIPARDDHVHSGTNAVLVNATQTSSILIAPEERWNVSATAVTTTTTVDYLTAQNWYYTTSSTAGACTLNIRGNSGTTLASSLNVGDSMTFTFAVTTGATTPAYFNAIQVDGTATGVTTRWQYGTTPTSGTTSGVDMYSVTVLKTASTPTYTVFASVAKW